MEILSVVNHQFVFLLPVGLVLLCAGLVFAFGFKSSVEPPSFRQLSFASEDRKQGIKKKKIKDKKSQSANGHATVLIEDNSESKKSDANNKLKQINKTETVKNKKNEEVDKVNKKQDNQKSPVKQDKKNKENVENKTKKDVKKGEEKPEDFDDGKWETFTSRKDKKNRKKEDDIIGSITPEKTPKKKTPDSPVKKQKQEEVKPQEVESQVIDNKLANVDDDTVKEATVVKEEEKVEPAPAPVPTPVQVKEEEAPAETTDDVASKKKKNRKPKTTTEKPAEEAVVVPAPVTAPVEKVLPQAAEVRLDTKVEENKPSTAAAALSSEPVFDELGDVWKEAPQKKSKKKVRKE